MPKYLSKCGFCAKNVSRTNFTRHARSFHLMCPKCLRLEARAKHPCFGARILTQTQWLNLNNTNPQNQTMDSSTSNGQNSFLELSNVANVSERPITSGVFIPIEMREDCLAALTACLAARQFLDHDLYTPALFLLSKLQRSCLACMSGKDGKIDMADFHSCRLYISQIMSDNCELTCNLFNVEYSDRSKQFFQNFLHENSYE